MAKKKTLIEAPLNFEFRMTDMEIISFSLNSILPSQIDSVKNNKVNFNIEISNRVIQDKKGVASVLDINVTDIDNIGVMCELKIAYLFEILNFNDVINEKDANGNILVSNSILETFNKISYGSTRGVFFMYLKGTPLHKALLPILDEFKSNIIK